MKRLEDGQRYALKVGGWVGGSQHATPPCRWAAEHAQRSSPAARTTHCTLGARTPFVLPLQVADIESLGPAEQADVVNEIRLLASLQHPNLTTFYEAFCDHSKLCIVQVGTAGRPAGGGGACAARTVACRSRRRGCGGGGHARRECPAGSPPTLAPTTPPHRSSWGRATFLPSSSAPLLTLLLLLVMGLACSLRSAPAEPLTRLPPLHPVQAPRRQRAEVYGESGGVWDGALGEWVVVMAGWAVGLA